MSHASGLSQVLVHRLLDDWGMNGFMQHTANVRNFYKQQRDAMLRSAERHLTGLCEWFVPAAGMFLWLRVLGLEDTRAMIMKEGIANNVLLVPGSFFQANSDALSPYLRASYSMTGPERIDVGLERLAKLIKAELEKR